MKISVKLRYVRRYTDTVLCVLAAIYMRIRLMLIRLNFFYVKYVIKFNLKSYCYRALNKRGYYFISVWKAH